MDERQRQLVRRHLVVALDVESASAAVELVERLGARVDRYKVGARLFTRHGPELLDALADRGAELFLDLKFHDIPYTVAGAVEAAVERGDVSMVTVHASGGREMLERATDAAGEAVEVVAVTALTSLDSDDVRAVSGEQPLEGWADRLARLALGAGVDGLVCSAREVGAFRESYGPEVRLVTPGIRPEGTGSDDQSRVVTPAEALEAGSDRLVVGRPVYRADDPVEAVGRIGRSLPGSS